MIDSLQQAKNDIRQGWETPDGATCGCCGQKVKLYKRKINSMIAYMLVRFYRLAPDGDYKHVGEIPMPAGSTTTGRDYAILRYWNLIEAMPNDDPNKRCSGLWRLTAHGRSFVLGEINVPKYCFIYNQTARSFSDDRINITEAIGDRFSYPELMGYLI